MNNDLINRSMLGIGYANPLVFDNPEFAKGWNAAIEIIAKVPAVDAVEVVRCCKCEYSWFRSTELYSRYCKHTGLNVRDNDFCSYGERSAE